MKKSQSIKGLSLTRLSGKNIMKDALEIRGRESPSNEENISTKEKKKETIARFFEKDVHLRRQESLKPEKEKRTGQIERLRPLVGLNFLTEV